MQHNEVLKNIHNIDDVKGMMRSPFMDVISRSFYDVTTVQIKSYKENYLAVKYVAKWKEFLAKRKRFRFVCERSRFWPGE